MDFVLFHFLYEVNSFQPWIFALTLNSSRANKIQIEINFNLICCCQTTQQISVDFLLFHLKCLCVFAFDYLHKWGKNRPLEKNKKKKKTRENKEDKIHIFVSQRIPWPRGDSFDAQKILLTRQEMLNLSRYQVAYTQCARYINNTRNVYRFMCYTMLFYCCCFVWLEFGLV